MGDVCDLKEPARGPKDQWQVFEQSVGELTSESQAECGLRSQYGEQEVKHETSGEQPVWGMIRLRRFGHSAQARALREDMEAIGRQEPPLLSGAEPQLLSTDHLV